MDDQTFNIAEAKTHFSRLIERVESGERITIARNNQPVAVVAPIGESPEAILSRIDAFREGVRARLGRDTVLEPGETWRDFVDEGRRDV